MKRNREEKSWSELLISKKNKKEEKDYEKVADLLYPTMKDKKKGEETRGSVKEVDEQAEKGKIKYGAPYTSLSKAYSDKSSLEEVLNDRNTLYKNELNDNRKDWERDDDFVKGLKFVYSAEGGYSNRKEDLGGETNLGITQDTYNYYNKKHNLPLKSVKNITKDEASKIYYDEYWKASGASKIQDKAMAMIYFDTAVNHGQGNAKKIYNRSGDDVNKFLEERKKFYDEIIINKPNQKANYKGWMNRLNNIRKFIEENT